MANVPYNFIKGLFGGALGMGRRMAWDTAAAIRENANIVRAGIDVLPKNATMSSMFSRGFGTARSLPMFRNMGVGAALGAWAGSDDTLPGGMLGGAAIGAAGGALYSNRARLNRKLTGFSNRWGRVAGRAFATPQDAAVAALK